MSEPLDPRYEPTNGDEEESSDREDFRRWIRRVWVAYIAMGLAMAVSVYLGVNERNSRIESNRDLINKVEDNLNQTNGSLCALRENLKQRVLTSQNFLDDNPNGIPGIPVGVIEKSINDQQETIDVLAGLEC